MTKHLTMEPAVGVDNFDNPLKLIIRQHARSDAGPPYSLSEIVKAQPSLFWNLWSETKILITENMHRAYSMRFIHCIEVIFPVFCCQSSCSGIYSITKQEYLLRRKFPGDI